MNLAAVEVEAVVAASVVVVEEYLVAGAAGAASVLTERAARPAYVSA